MSFASAEASLVAALDVDRLARGHGIALWRQIEGALEQAVVQGSFGPSGRLPAEPELARRFGVNRHTVRQAVKALASRGILRIEQGRGTFVDTPPLDYRIGERTRYSTSLASRERLPSRVTLGIDRIRLDGPIAEALGLVPAAPAIRRRSIGYADSTPINLASVYLDDDRFPSAAQALAANPSMTAFFTSVDHGDYRRGWTRIATRLPSPEEAHHLQQPRERPVLVTEALDVSAQELPLAFNHTVWAGERVTLTVER